ncbi:MlaC/ttg2D family ABC transporter substrate-binding protein [Alkalimarinus alittae]|uniref:ABC transporter substrate-binding protein n=1 Tax=Alkalimarinus alittae TaxID=2961619 RepID=A0ABY6MZD8_9ALTE|nr:ABC transporter substrate-binding protein [Alkalimarinus alittae]UZE95198.1 ABC transporter substrate-binding protein [Alkalimarinus alittae]
MAFAFLIGFCIFDWWSSVIMMASFMRLTQYLIVSVLFSSIAVAGSIESDVKKIVEDSTSQLVEKLNQEKATYDENPERFYREMDIALSKLVDFKRIAARVMGKNARTATKDQRARFLDSFKQSLYVAYSKALVESGAFEISVEDVMVNPRSDKKASVNLVVTSASGNQYPVVYSMNYGKNNKWMLENVIVNGVNVGLAFRDRFSQEMRTQQGDIDKVIESWSAQIDVESADASAQ